MADDVIRKTPDWVAEIEFQGLHIDIAELHAQLKDVIYIRYIIFDNILGFLTALAVFLSIVAMPISQRYQMAEWSRSNFVDVEFFAKTSYEELAGAEPVTEAVKSFDHIDTLLKWEAWVDQVIWPKIDREDQTLEFPNILLNGIRFRS